MPRPAWKFAFLSALATLSADSSMAARPEPVKDFSRQLEVVVGGRLRETKKGQGELAITVWNKTATSVAGPIFVVIDDTGLEQVQVGSHDMETAKGKPMLLVVAEGKELIPGAMTSSIPVAFSMPEGMTRDEAAKLHLETRVFGRTGRPDAAQIERERQAREDADFATSGKSYTQADLEAAFALQAQATPDILKKPDTLATAITEDDKGNLALRVYTETRAAAKNLPGSVGDLKIDVKPIPGGFKGGPSLTTVTRKGDTATSLATREKAGKNTSNKPSLVTKVNTQQRFERPVPIGVSSFNGDNNVCAAGTLGVRVKDVGGKLYVLSNTHVWGDMGFATVGQRVVQPSQGDNNCVADPINNTIALLTDFTAYRNSDPASQYFHPGLNLNFIDAAIAEVVNSTNSLGETVPAVGVATPSDGYGAPSSRILTTNRMGLQVQKYGRTTGYTRGYTSAMNVQATIDPPPDATPFYRIDEYTGMAGVSSLGDRGDSGSLIVTLADRRPISLLFAGNLSTLTWGNRIAPVLSWFNVTIDDGQDPDVHVGGETKTGMSPRGAMAMGNISRRDLTAFEVKSTGTITFPGSTTTYNPTINELLPPELRGRVKANRPPLTPLTRGTAFP